jgi:signal transduction histidine kinase
MNLQSTIKNRLNKDHKRSGLVLFSLSVIIIIIISLVFVSLSFIKPYIGVVLSLKSQGWVVESVDSNGSAVQAGIHTGDIPVEVNGQLAQSFLEKYQNVRIVYGSSISELTVVDQSGNIKSISLEHSTLSPNSIVELISWIITFIVFWIVAFFVFIKRPWNLATRLVCLCGLFFGLMLSSIIAGERNILTAIPFSVVAMAISPFLLFHFFLVLPDERAHLRSNPLIYLIYLPAMATIILFFLVGYTNDQPVPWFRSVRIVEAILVLLATVCLAILNYLLARSTRTRQQMKIILVSSFAGLIPFIILNAIPTLIWKQNNIPSGFNVLFIALIPIGMGYAVITQKLLDIDIIIRRGVIYGIITVIMAIILSAGVFPLFVFRESMGVPEEILVTLILGAVATILFGPVTKATELTIDRLFYKDRYDYRQIIQNLTNSLNRLTDSEDISRLVIVTASNSLNLAGACLYVKSNSSYELRAALGTLTDTKKQTMLLTHVSPNNILTEFPNYASNLDPSIAFIIRLVAGEKEIGVLFISPKSSRQDFSNNDIYLLQGIADVAASALRSAMLIRDVSIRNTFISIASHELRTPLTSIVGFADLLLHKKLDEDTREIWTRIILDNGNKITAMVDDLLNVSRIQSGKVKMKLEPTNLVYLLDEQMDLIRQINNKHDFIVDIEPDLPSAIIDRDKFGHVVGNLLSNAVKYSPKGGHITLSAHYNMERNRIIVTVADEGIGIGTADQQSLFTTFHRIQRAETMGIRGSGLGLYIAKEWTEAMGGEIWLESELDKGSKFFLGVPVHNSNKIDSTDKIN